jgi:hypothetical protein
MQGFDKTSDILDNVSSETQKVVFSSMEEEVQSSRGVETHDPSTNVLLWFLFCSIVTRYMMTLWILIAISWTQYAGI